MSTSTLNASVRNAARLVRATLLQCEPRRVGRVTHDFITRRHVHVRDVRSCRAEAPKLNLRGIAIQPRQGYEHCRFPAGRISWTRNAHTNCV